MLDKFRSPIFLTKYPRDMDKHITGYTREIQYILNVII